MKKINWNKRWTISAIRLILSWVVVWLLGQAFLYGLVSIKVVPKVAVLIWIILGFIVSLLIWYRISKYED